MSAFFYFAAGVTKPVEFADLSKLGLGHAFDETPQSSPLRGRTPANDEPGMLIWSQARLGAMQPGYLPADQEWRKVPGRDGLYVGFHRESPPTPASLRRKRVMAGEAITLGDGNEWTVPRLKLFAGEQGFEPAYPVVVDLDEAGNWVSGGADGDSLAMAALFDRLFVGMTSSEGITPEAGLDSCVELLAINYAVSKIECAMLRVLKTDGTLMQTLRAAMDWDCAMDWAQKKTPVTSPPAEGG